MFRLELHRWRQGGNESEKCMIYYVIIIIKSQLELQGDSHRAVYTLHHLS
mgnify:CR=1 FL=1